MNKLQVVHNNRPYVQVVHRELKLIQYTITLLAGLSVTKQQKILLHELTITKDSCQSMRLGVTAKQLPSEAERFI
jgi:hypothetical protein